MAVNRNDFEALVDNMYWQLFPDGDGRVTYGACRPAPHLLQQDAGKAALAVLRAGFVPVPICPRFDKPAVDLETWLDDLSPRGIRAHWLAWPKDQVGLLLERSSGKEETDDDDQA